METATETQNGTATRRRLERPNDDRVIAGVAAGIAEYTGVSTPFVRIAAIVLTIFGGISIPLYVAGWLLIPSQDETNSPAERYLDRLDTTEKRIGAALMAIAGAIVITGSTSPGLIAVVALAAVGYALTRPSSQKKEN